MLFQKKGKMQSGPGKIAISIVVLSGMLSLAACSPKQTVSGDVLSQKVTPKGKTQITVLVKHAFSIHAFEKAVEEEFPNIDLVQVANYTRNTGVLDFEKRMEQDDLADLIMTWPLDTGSQYWEDRLIELSGMEFTGRYNLSMLNKISKDGKLYYLPGPAQIRGIVYNKTLFEEKGWEVPEDFEGFIALCKEIEKSGIRPIQLGLANSEVLDTAFIGYGYSACYSKPADTKWIQDFNNGNGSFGEHFMPALDTFQRMIDEGIWRAEDLNVEYAQRETMLFNRECAMTEDSVFLTKQGVNRTGCTDEFALMPFFNPGGESDWARLYMVCYIGMNQHLAEPENKEKYRLALELMDYISTTEGQNALMADTGAMFSSIKGTVYPDVPEVEELLSALSHGRFAVFPELKNVQTTLRDGLTGMLKGQITAKDVVEMVDEQNRNPKPPIAKKLLGVAAENFSLTDTGSFVTDAMRVQADSDIALFLDNGKDGCGNNRGIAARIYKGDLTYDDIDRIINDLKVGKRMTLWKATMTGENLLNTLEYAVPTDNNATGWFYYASGLNMEFAPAAVPGSRVKKVTLADGSPIDPQKVYSIAAMEDTLPAEYLLSCEKEAITIADMIADAIRKAGTIYPAKDQRFKVLD